MIEFLNVTKTYINEDSNKIVLDDVNFEFPDKGFFCIEGKSGTGKSTILNLIGGLDSPTKGNVIVDGHSLSQLTETELDSFRKDYVGFIFQEYNLIDELTVYENISISNLKHNENAQFVTEILTKVGLLEQKNQRISELSGGEKQRVAIARVLMRKPRYLLADEPTGNLDVENSLTVFKILKELSKDALVILVTHDIELSKPFCDYVLQLPFLHQSNKTSFENEKSYANILDLSSKTKLTKHVMWKLVTSNLKFKKVRLTLITILITLMTVFLYFSISNLSYNEYEVVHNAFLEEELEFIKYEYLIDCDNCNDKNLKTVQDIQNIQSQFEGDSYLTVDDTYHVSDIIQDYIEPTSIDWLTDYSSGLIIAEHDFQIFDLVSGEYPNSPREVLVTDYYIEMLNFYSENTVYGVGSVITLDKYFDNTLTISGVIKTNYLEYLLLDETNYRLNMDSKEEFEYYRDNLYSKIYMQSETYSLLVKEYISVEAVLYEENYGFYFYTISSQDYLDENAVYGSYTTDEEDVILNLSKILIYEEIDYDTFIDNREMYLDMYIGSNLVLNNVDGNFQELSDSFIIVGLYDDVSYELDSNSSNQIFLEDELYNKLEDEHNQSFKKGLITSTSSLNEELYDYYVTNDYLHDTYVSNSTNYFIEIIEYVILFANLIFVAIFVFVMIVLYTYYNMLVQSRKKQTGVLRSLGISIRDCTKILSVESIIIVSIAYALAIPIIFVLVNRIDLFFYSEFNLGVAIYSIYLFKMVILFVMNVCLIYMVTYISTYKPMRVSVIRNLRDR